MLLPEQKRIWEYMQTDIMPMAEGKDTALSKQMMQQAQDSAALARASSEQNIMDVAGRTGMGSAQIASLLSSADRDIISKQIEAMNNSKMQMAQQALGMIGSLPISPGTKTTTKTKDTTGTAKMIAGAALGAATGGLGAAAMGMSTLAGTASGAMSGLSQGMGG